MTTKGRRCVLFLCLCLVLLILPSCLAPDPTFVQASRDTHSAIAPEYVGYVNADPKLDEAQRERRRRTVARWDEAIRAREGQR